MTIYSVLTEKYLVFRCVAAETAKDAVKRCAHYKVKVLLRFTDNKNHSISIERFNQETEIWERLLARGQKGDR